MMATKRGRESSRFDKLRLGGLPGSPGGDKKDLLAHKFAF